MPFGLVSAWNKRRRSKCKSQYHTDPCIFFTSSLSVSASPQYSYITFMSSTFQGFINLWSFGNLKIKPPNTPKGTMDQFSHSRKWRRQLIHSVKRICLAKEDLAEFIEALCNQERYVLLVSFVT